MPDVKVDIVAEDRSSSTVRSVAREYEKLGGTAKVAAGRIDDLGDETGRLSRQMLEAQAAARLLGREFEKTGDKRFLRDIERLNREASRLGRVMKSIKIDEPSDFFGSGLVSQFKRAGLIAGEAAVDSLAGAFNALPAEVKGAALATGLVIVGGIEGAVTAAVAGGGLLAGLALGAQDPRVKQAYAKLGTDIFTALKADAAPFATELLDAAPKLQQAFEAQSPRIKRIFTGLAQDVEPLLDNVIASINRIAPAIERASAAGGKVLVSLSGTLPILAGSVGDLLDSLSDSSSGAAVSLNLLVLTAAGAITVFSQLQLVLNPLLIGLGKLGEITGLVNTDVKDLETIQKDAGTGAGMAAQQYASLGNALGNTADQADALNTAFERLFTEQMSVDQANLAVNVGMRQLTDTIKDNRKTLDESTKSGQENVGVILDQIRNLEAKRQADIAAGNGTKEAADKANAAYASNVASLRAVLIQLGLAPAAVDALIAKYAQIPQTITTTITTVYRTDGTPAMGHSRDLPGQYGGLDGWAPARHAAGQRADMAGDGGGTYRTGGPTSVHSEVAVSVNLDGAPFQAMTSRVVSAAERRQAHRAKVGRR